MESYHFINHSDGHRAGRTYAVWMQTNLFGEWVVVRVHGGRRGQLSRPWSLVNPSEDLSN